MHFIFLRQCFYGLLLFNGFNANFTFKFGSKFSAACFTHPDRSFRLQISILFSCLKNREYYIGYEYETLSEYEKYFGRLIIKFKNTSQNMIRNAESVLEVI